MKRFIYQIGRLDRNYRDNLSFVYKDNNYNKPLSSLALKEYFKQDAEVIVIYPVSIVYNNKILESLKDDDFAKLVKSEINDYLDDPKKVLKNHPHNKEASSFIVIHSFGTYEKPDTSEKLIFNSHYDDIVLEILCDLIERYLNISTEKSEFYFDISSGLNIYISAMLEAVRHFATFAQLKNWFNKDIIPKIFISFSDPILGSSLNNYKLYIQQLSFKAFFSSPLTKEDKERLPSILFPDVEDENEKRENRRRRGDLKKILENFLVFFLGPKE
ncbi:hypothetical protein [Hydrogenobaculum acidophilum]